MGRSDEFRQIVERGVDSGGVAAYHFSCRPHRAVCRVCAFDINV